jgi:hypothetical protein
MKVTELRQIIREEIQKIISEQFKSFGDLENAIDKHEAGVIYYDEQKIRNIFNQLTDDDQLEARRKFPKYFVSIKK